MKSKHYTQKLVFNVTCHIKATKRVRVNEYARREKYGALLQKIAVFLCKLLLCMGKKRKCMQKKEAEMDGGIFRNWHVPLHVFILWPD